MTIPDVEFETLLSQLRRYIPAKDSYCRYFRDFFPKLKKHFISNSKNQIPDSKPKVLISLLGFSPPPVAFCIAALKPEKVYFIYPDERKINDYRSLIIEALKREGIKFELGDTGYIDPSESADVYKCIKAIVDMETAEIRKEVGQEDISQNKKEQKIAEFIEKNIAIDISGGKKTMTSGAYMAAAMKGLNIYYVDYTEFDHHANRPRDGSEILRKVANPYHIFSERQQTEAKKLFNKHQYEAAYSLYEKAANAFGGDIKKYLDDSFKSEIRQRKTWADIYRKWENMKYQDALNAFTFDHSQKEYLKILSRLDNKLKYIRENPPDKMHGITVGEESRPNITLEALFKEDTDGTKDKKGEFIAHYLVDIYNRSQRCFNQHKYDDGLIRLFRVFDIGGLYAIYEKGEANPFVDGKKYRTWMGGIIHKQAEQTCKIKEIINKIIKKVDGKDCTIGIIWGKLKNIRNELNITHSITRGAEYEDKIAAYQQAAREVIAAVAGCDITDTEKLIREMRFIEAEEAEKILL